MVNTDKSPLPNAEPMDFSRDMNASPSLQRVLNTKNDDKSMPTKPIVPPKPSMDDQCEESELLTPHKTKTLTLKKKNSILAKRRKICLKTLEISDIQGHLFRRMKDKHGVTYWAKYYFVMVETALYGFRNKRSQKASCLIFLHGFTISLAKEVHSKPFAYKVYHPRKTFYFAAETEQALGQWMEYIRRATLKGSATNIDPMLVDSVNTKDLFSETDSSEDENEFDDAPQVSSFKHALLGGSRSKKRGSVDETSTSTPKSEKYHLGFGSLKKFTNLHNLPFTSSKSDKERDERKKAQSDIPVPTAQFRSYRKIPGNAGMQLGSSSILPMDYNIMTQRTPHTVQTPKTIPEQISSKPNEMILIKSTVQKIEQPPMQSSPPVPIKLITNSPIPSPSTITIQHETIETHLERKPISKLAKSKTSPFNYMHASNPNLVEFTFQTSKTLDVGLPKVNASNTFDPHQNPQNMITLKDLMLQREEDEALNQYNIRVNFGFEKQNDRQTKRKHRRDASATGAAAASATASATTNENQRSNDENENTPQNGQKNKIQSRSLPKTPDYAQSFKTDDSEIIMARSKEGQKLRDFGYEFITGDDVTNSNIQMVNSGASNQSIKKPAVQPKPNDRFLLSSKRKGLNWIGLSSDKRNDDEKLLNKGSFKLNKQKDAFPTTKYETYRPIVLNRFAQSNNKLENDVFHTPASTTTTFTTNHRNDSITSQSFPLNGERKQSATIQTSYLSKLTFPTTKTAKEKRLLGSPRLHRAASSLFGRKTSDTPSIEHEIFSPINDTTGKYSSNDCFRSVNSNSTINSNYLNQFTSATHMDNENKYGATRNPIESSGLTNPSTPITTSTSVQHILAPTTCSTFMNSTTDQNIEYPPVFEPETYSLCDPHASLKLIRRRTINRYNNNNNKNE